MTQIAARLTNSGNLLVDLASYSQFDEVTQTNISITPFNFYASSFDELTIQNSSTQMRLQNTGNTVQIAGQLDETTVLNPSSVAVSFTYNTSSNLALPGGTSANAVVNNMSIGTADPTRIVVVTISAGTSATQNLAGVFFNGNLGIRAVRNPGTNFRFEEIWYASIATGTTCNIIVQLGTYPWGGALTGGISSFSIYNAQNSNPIGNASVVNTGLGVHPTLFTNISIPAGPSVAIAGYGAGAVTAGSTSTWGNITKQSDNIYTSDPSEYTSAASLFTSAQTANVVVTSSSSTVNRPQLSIAVWQ